MILSKSDSALSLRFVIKDSGRGRKINTRIYSFSLIKVFKRSECLKNLLAIKIKSYKAKVSSF